MRVLVTEVKTDHHGLGVKVSLGHRTQQWERTLWVPWKWVAATDAWEHIEAELSRQGRPVADPIQPLLPLEKWE